MADRKIKALEQQLRAIQNQELWALSAREQARIVAHTARGGAAITRGKAPSGADQAIDRVFSDAARRVETDLAALRQVEEENRRQQVAAKVARLRGGR